MGVSFDQFQQIANSTCFASRDIVVNANNTAKLGNFIFSSGKATNKATMQAFRTALAQRYGVFGEHAFDTVVGRRAQMQKSLRACDVKAAFSSLETLKQKRFINELARQLDTDPKVRELSKDMRQAIRDEISKPYSGCRLTTCHTPLDIARMASSRIAQAIDIVKADVTLGRKHDTTTHTLNGRKEVETSAKSDEPTGLCNLKTIFKKGQTSIEDKVKQGTAGVGMRINRSTTNPVLLHALKTNGVEPGFIYKRELYLRTSTHARAYHHQTVDGHMNMPRGLDIPEGMGGLMGGMRTLHYFTLPQAGGQARRLYLKCETYGIYRSTISKADEEASRTPGMQTRQKRVGDTRESLKHCFSLFTVITRRGPGEGNRKETTPQAILDATAAAQRDLRQAGLGHLADILGQDLKGGGMRKLMDNLSTIADTTPTDATVRKVIGDIMDAAETYIRADAQRTGDGINRMGNEVMLEAREIL